MEEESHEGKSAWALESHNAALDAPAWPSVFSWAPTVHLFISKRKSKLGSWVTQPPTSEDIQREPTFPRMSFISKRLLVCPELATCLLCILLQPVSFHTSQRPHVPAHNAFRSPWKLLKGPWFSVLAGHTHDLCKAEWASGWFCLET